MKKAFRLHPPVLSDLGTTTVRIEPEHMKSLGIKPGDMVKVTGMKSTGAICLSIDPGYNLPNDSEIVYLSQSEILPQARISDIVSTNIGMMSNTGLVQVEIEKTLSNNADKVSIASLDGRSCETRLDKNKLLGLVVCKNDRFYYNYDPIPEKNFAITITDVAPGDYCTITKDTKLEFLKNIPSEITQSWATPKLGTIKRVIPVARQLHTEFMDMTIPSLEIYDNVMRFYLYQRGAFGNKQEFFGGHPSFSGMTLYDDIGNSYELSSFGGGGSSGGNEFNFDWSFVTSLAHPNAKELIFTIKEIVIQAPFSCTPSSMDHMMTDLRYSTEIKFPSFLIISGPWQIKIKL